MAQGLVEGAVDAEQQGGRECQGEHGQIVFNLRSERRRHLRPAQQRARRQQHRHAQHSRRSAQVQGLPQ